MSNIHTTLRKVKAQRDKAQRMIVNCREVAGRDGRDYSELHQEHEQVKAELQQLKDATAWLGDRE